MKTTFLTQRPQRARRIELLILCVLGGLSASNLFAKTPTPSPVAGNANILVEVTDVSDPTAIKLKTSDRGEIVCGTLHDCIANYPQLKDGMISATTKKLESEDEISAQRRMQIMIGQQKIDLPKAAIDKHNARIAKFTKAKEDALNAAIKKAQSDSKVGWSKAIELTASSKDIEDGLRQHADARALALRAKAKQEELLQAGIPISKATQDAVNAAQPKATPTPASSPTPTPDGL